MAKLAEKVEKTEKTEDKKTLCVFKVSRKIGGVEVYIKSDLYEEFFHKISGGKATASSGGVWGDGEKYYQVAKCSVPRADYEYNVNVQGYGGREIIYPENQSYDFSFVKTVGIADGVTFKVNGMILQEDIDRFQKDFIRFTKAFFINYAKETSLEVTISSRI